MRASSRRLAAALAQRVGEALPAPLTIRAQGDRVGLYADGIDIGGSAAALIVEDEDDRTPADHVETAVRAVLGRVQDCIAEYLTQQWPTDAEGRMAMPVARADADGVHAWFGSSRRVPCSRSGPSRSRPDPLHRTVQPQRFRGERRAGARGGGARPGSRSCATPPTGRRPLRRILCAPCGAMTWW